MKEVHKDLDKKERSTEEYVKDKQEMSNLFKSNYEKKNELLRDSQTIFSEGVADKKRLVESEVLTAEEAVTPVNLGKVDSSDTTKSSGVKGSLLDDYADTSTELADYTGGDD